MHTSVAAHMRRPLQIWPNPATDIVHLASDGSLGTLIVYDLYGRAVIRMSGIADGTTEVNVSGLPAGVYFLQSATGTTKLVKW